ncbi:lanthionine synthetase C family protein [Frankia sp. CNm7]|uniref:Lanthionine synthetase C family protein n=1 Tax=Frankia nepalensis TaxID=1836974 RepID=A0A937RBH9_9ACTN|nr:lanthionine synthetase C family protein [Frankia nepalensis]MBL7499874.1 lanthionine synthetase C family protein [Frankia nepalensis]MBL7512308.1 lanthionine synthetase C family protein [Frankia nepalensis]MBL7516969.1 lanthionine synthetase C family protein [Frankia nepalensis]MBL7629016.1 lanthionine synthetase C family protein [Frankia nepalensis]
MTSHAPLPTRLAHAADLAAAQLARPAPGLGGHPQSLSHGAAGIALLHIERAARGLGDWGMAHRWLRTAADGQLIGSPDNTLLFGTPALAFALHGAARGVDRYHRVLSALDANIATLTQVRLARAHARIDRGERPDLAEFDLLKGLTGIGAHLRRRGGDSDLLRQILTYLVRLTQPLTENDPLPGWWTSQPPTGTRAENPGNGGHGNLSLAHGISGPLALLSLTALDGTVVNEHHDAITRICAWLDTWRQDSSGGPWWPEIVTPTDSIADLSAGRLPRRPRRAAWCYGTPGHARAQQLAGRALGDTERQRDAEQALAACLADPVQLGHLTDPGLCHGVAGLFQTTWRVAADAASTDLRSTVPGLAERLLAHADAVGDVGVLTGTAGWALAVHTAASDQAPATAWDALLLLS